MFFIPDFATPWMQAREAAINANWADRARFAEVHNADMNNVNTALNLERHLTQQPGYLANDRAWSEMAVDMAPKYWPQYGANAMKSLLQQDWAWDEARRVAAAQAANNYGLGPRMPSPAAAPGTAPAVQSSASGGPAMPKAAPGAMSLTPQQRQALPNGHPGRVPDVPEQDLNAWGHFFKAMENINEGAPEWLRNSNPAAWPGAAYFGWQKLVGNVEQAGQDSALEALKLKTELEHNRQAELSQRLERSLLDPSYVDRPIIQPLRDFNPVSSPNSLERMLRDSPVMSVLPEPATSSVPPRMNTGTGLPAAAPIPISSLKFSQPGNYNQFAPGTGPANRAARIASFKPRSVKAAAKPFISAARAQAQFDSLFG
jgi:hypothetical protein